MAVNIGDKVLQLDIDTYYSRLNAVRAKHGLTSVAKPSTAIQGGLATAADMLSMATQMTALSSISCHIPVKTYTISGVAKGSPIYYSHDLQVRSYLTELESYCHDDSANYAANLAYDGSCTYDGTCTYDEECMYDGGSSGGCTSDDSSDDSSDDRNDCTDKLNRTDYSAHCNDEGCRLDNTANDRSEDDCTDNQKNYTSH